MIPGTLSALLAARENLAAPALIERYKVSARVFPVESFPVTPGADATKIQKRKPREMAIALLN